MNIVSARASGVLAVPISALVALAGGGYAVQVITGGTAHLTGVRTGLFSSSLVQVSGPGSAGRAEGRGARAMTAMTAAGRRGGPARPRRAPVSGSWPA